MGGVFYSDLKLVAGLAIAALVECIIAVAAEVITMIAAGNRKARTVNPVLYGKRFNQRCMKYHAIGNAIPADISASHK